MPSKSLRPATASLIVTDADTATALKSGDVPVLATPRLIALCEEATCTAMGPRLEPGETTVGTRVEIAHLLATPVGQKVTAEATLEKTEGRRLIFTVSVTSAQGLVAAGKITRVIVDRAHFIAKTQ